MEAIRIRIGADTAGTIRYRAHVAQIGWMDWMYHNEVAGTTGRGLQMEAVEIQLTGDLATRFNVQYRAHVAGIGWQNWVANGATAGTTGQQRPVEALEIRIVPR